MCICIYHSLTHCGQVTHICSGKLTIVGSDNGLSPGRRQAIIWTNAEILLIGPLGTNFSEILIEILIFSYKKMLLKVLSAKWRPFCFCLSVLTLLRSTCKKHQNMCISQSLPLYYQVTSNHGIDMEDWQALLGPWWWTNKLMNCMI